MKKLVFLLVILPTIVNGQTQIEMNRDASEEYYAADSLLNRMYDKIFKSYSSDTAFLKNLETSQQLWIRFRYAELKMKYPDSYSYGSVQPMCVSLYLTDLTKERIETLQTWLDGIEEGDVCAGSVKIKD